MITINESTLAGLMPQTEPLPIYLNDHLAGATAGLELFRRAAASVPPQHRDALRRLTSEIESDRAALIEMMGALAVPVRHYKVVAGWAGEKLGRVKPNGRLVGRSPLASLLELEALVVGVRGKAAGWQALRVVAQHDPRLSIPRLDELIARADRQQEELEQMRQQVATEIFT